MRRLLVVYQLFALVQCQENSLLASLSAQPDLSNFTTILQRHPDLLSSLSGGNLGKNYTVLAPTNAALAAYNQSNEGVGNASEWEKAVLSYHVMQGLCAYQTLNDVGSWRTIPTLLSDPSYTNVTGGQTIIAESQNGSAVIFSAERSVSNIVQHDIVYTGGLIHVVDAALQMPRNVFSTVNENINNWNSFEALFTFPPYQSLITTGLGNLSYRNDMTYIIENDTVLAAEIKNGSYQISASTALQNIRYYLIEGTVAYTSVMGNGTTFQSLQGADITVTLLNGGIYLNDARITGPDYLLSNGVLQVINGTISLGATGARPTWEPPQHEHSHKFGGGAIAGIVVGSVAGAVCVAGVIALFLLWQRRRRRGIATSPAELNGAASQAVAIATAPEKVESAFELHGGDHNPASPMTKIPDQSDTGSFGRTSSLTANTESFYIPYRPPPMGDPANVQRSASPNLAVRMSRGSDGRIREVRSGA